MKKLIRSLIPSNLMEPLLKPYHFLKGFVAAAKYRFPARGMTIVMITGTNGKTTTTGYLAEILQTAGLSIGVSSTAFYVVGDEYELNNKNMTVANPFDVQNLLKKMKTAKVDVVIMETTSHALDQNRLFSVRPTVAAITNLTQDHLDYHHTMDAYAAAKAKLFKKGAKTAVLNADDEWYEYYNQRTDSPQIERYGIKSPEASYRLSELKLSSSGSSGRVSSRKGSYELKTTLLGEFNVYNALCAAACAEAVGVSQEHIAKGIAALSEVPGRMEEVRNGRGVKVLVDYAHTADALEKTLIAVREVTEHRLFCIFGATGDRDKGKRPDMGRVVATHADVCVVTDDEPYSEDAATIRQEVLKGANAVKNGGEVTEYDNRRTAIHETIRRAKKGDTVLLAGIGHQQYRVVGDGIKEPWSEKEVALEILGKKDT